MYGKWKGLQSTDLKYNYSFADYGLLVISKWIYCWWKWTVEANVVKLHGIYLFTLAKMAEFTIELRRHKTMISSVINSL